MGDKGDEMEGRRGVVCYQGEEEEKEEGEERLARRFQISLREIRRRIKGSWQRGVIRSYKCGWLIADSRFHGDALVKRAAER